MNRLVAKATGSLTNGAPKSSVLRHTLLVGDGFFFCRSLVCVGAELVLIVLSEGGDATLAVPHLRRHLVRDTISCFVSFAREIIPHGITLI